MKIFINKIYKLFGFLKNPTRDKSSYLTLVMIKQVNQEIICEFQDSLTTSGHLLKINIKDIITNKNIQRNIKPEVLILIGAINESNRLTSLEYKLKVMDIINQTLVLENCQEKITIRIDELLNDMALIRKINQIDLLKIICPLIYSRGYKAMSQFSPIDSNDIENKPTVIPTKENISKIIFLKNNRFAS